MTSLGGAHILLRLLIEVFVPSGPIVLALDDTIARRWGRRIRAWGLYRDPERSSAAHFVKMSGLRWMSLYTTPTGSGPTCEKKASRRSSPASAAASGRSATTSAATANAGALRRPSIASRTSVASPPATTSWPATTPRPSRSPPSSPSGADRVQTLVRLR